MQIKDLLISAERRIAFAAEHTEGDVSAELLLAGKEIRECINRNFNTDVQLKNQQTVLFVDDEELIRKIASQMLSAEGYNVLTAVDGDQGLALFKAEFENIHCVILDLVMPGLNGVQLADAIADINPDVGQILTSGYGEEEIRKRFGSLKRRVFIRKPFSASILLETVKRVIPEDTSL